MKVVLVGINSKYVHTNLAIRNLKAYFEKNYWIDDIKIYIFEATINDILDDILERIVDFKPDVIGFSLYIWNFNQVIYLAENLKKVKPEVKVILGGPEASYDVEGLLKKDFIDFVVIGEGEEAFSRLLLALNGGGSFEEVDGIAFKKAESIIVKNPLKYVDLNLIPLSYEEDLDFKNRIIYYETSRGCPFNCAFCLSSLDRKVREADLEKVEKDLRLLVNKKARVIKFVDRSFNYNIDRALKIVNIFKKIGGDTIFHCEINPELVSEEFAANLEGLQKKLHFELGIQTTNPLALEEIRRNKDVEKAIEGIKILKDKEVPIHVDLIAGLPYDDFESFKEAFNKVYNLKPDELQLGFLKLLKGTMLRERAKEYGIVFRSQPPYEILYNNWMSYEELSILKGIARLIDKFYNSHRFDNTLSYLEKNFESPFDLCLSLYRFLKNENFFMREYSLESLYEKLYYFAKAQNLDLLYIKDLMRYDYLLSGGKGKLPSILSDDEEKQKELVKNFLRDKERLVKIFKNRFTASEIMKNLNAAYFVFDVPENQKKENIILMLIQKGEKETVKVYI
ncbi:MAG: B12-binding domain-containing radical SAM protein [Thermovenabulum sp.]|uniref:B12-binding domain-containing radical SAM protein n=1 Tax=Thermovenabulum sp. TaxID=3100335 RepID=UPI003C7A9E2D